MTASRGLGVVGALVVVVAGLVALREVAAAEPAAQRKQAPDKFVRAAHEAFVAAVAADQRGELPIARGLYQRAFEIAPHPSTIYNLADVQRRLRQLTDAIISYETYLAISPNATDRAEIEALIDRLARTPATLFLTTTPPSDSRSVDLEGAYVLIDGRIASRPGAKLSDPPAGGARGLALEVAPGALDVDIVTPLTHAHTTCRINPGQHQICSVRAAPRTDGNVVISGPDRNMLVLLDHRDRRSASRMHARFALPRGRATLLVRDGAHECPALVVEAPAGNQVAYVFIAVSEPSTYQRCRTLELRRQRLVFKP